LRRVCRRDAVVVAGTSMSFIAQVLCRIWLALAMLGKQQPTSTSQLSKDV